MESARIIKISKKSSSTINSLEYLIRIIPIPKSIKLENISVFDFNISVDDINELKYSN